MHSCDKCDVDAAHAHRQKQVDAALLRARNGQEPRGKCRAFLDADLLTFYHYHHLLLVFNTRTRTVQFRWHERPTDLRVLLAVQAALLCDARNAFDMKDEPDSSQVATEPCTCTPYARASGGPDSGR